MTDLNAVPVDTEEEVDEVVETAGADAREPTIVTPSVIPTAEELTAICAGIKETMNFDVDVKPTTFRFKTTKDGDVEVKRDALELPIPYPSMNGLLAIIEGGGKGLELLLDAIESVITQQARSLISDDWDINATNVPTDKLSWEFIANMPKAERSGGGIAKEVWEDFGTDYIKTMPEVTGKSTEQITNASKLLVTKFANCKTNMPVLGLLVEQLALYLEHSTRAEEFSSGVAFLVDKADKLMNTSPEELLANL